MSKLALGVFAILVAALLATPIVGTHAATLEQNNFQLSVIPLAPKLPADGKEYFVTIQLQTSSDGKPAEAPHDINTILSTSDASIVSIQSHAVIPAGESLITATISTTEKAGNIELTALAEGVRSSITSLSTVRPDSLEPSKLAVYAGSGAFVPDPALAGRMYVQLLNSADVPAVAKAPVTVYLSSSDSKIGTVPKQVSIPAGATGVSVNFTPTFLQGTTAVTADANGLTPGRTTVSTAGPIGSKLVVEFAPPSMPAPEGFYSAFTVQVRDSNDVPVKASHKISISLSSSDTDVAKVPGSLTIEPGSSYVLGKIQSGGNIGSSTVTASAQGFAAGFATVNTVAHTEALADAPKRISAYAIPSVIVPDSREKAIVIVQVTDTSGNPYSFQYHHYISVFTSSSDPNVGAIKGSLVSDVTYATTSFQASFYQGKTTITASKDGYLSGQATLNTKGSVPVALQVVQMPAVVVANGKSSATLVVSLLDEKGKPVTTQSDVLVGLSSSEQDVASVEATEMILAGKSSVQVEVETTTKAGITTITATAPELASSSVSFKTTGSSGEASPYDLAVSAIPRLAADGKTYDAVFVRLQDSGGNPVPAREDVHVALSSSSGAAGSVEKSITIEKGALFKVAKFTATTTSAKFKIAASAQGFGTVEADLETTVQPLSVALSSPLPSKASFDNIPVSADVYSGAAPLQGATVRVGGLYANTTLAITNEGGHAESRYVPGQPGRNTITITATKPGYELKSINYDILLEQTIDVNIYAMTEGGNSVPLQAQVSGSSGTKTLNIAPGLPVKVENIEWGLHRVSVPAQLTTADAKYEFVQWSDGVQQNSRPLNVIDGSTITAVYSAQYLLQVSSSKGATTGTGYYAEGDKATISVSPQTISGFPVDSSFSGWSGGAVVAASSPATEVVVDGPKSVRAEWADSYVKLFGIVAAAGAGGFAAYYKVIKPKRDAAEKVKAPDLDWYKS
jgi:hypothetical protein